MKKNYCIHLTQSKYQEYIDFLNKKREDGMSIPEIIKSLIDKELDSMTEEERAKVMEYAIEED